MAIIKKDNTKSLFFLLLLSPILAVFAALANYKEKGSRIIVFFVLVLYGLTMVYNVDGLDSTRDADAFKYWANSSFSQIFDYFKNLFVLRENVDFVQPLLMFILSRFTDNPAIYFGAIAAIYAAFYLKSINHIYDHFYDSKNRNALIHLAFFTALLPIFNISGVRWALAAWVFFYAAYLVLYNKETKFLILALITPLIHFSFLGPVLLLIGFLLLEKRNIIYYGLIVVSFFISPLVSNYISDVKTNTFAGIQERVLIYTNKETAELKAESLAKTKWYTKYQGDFIWIYLAIGIFVARQRLRFVSRDNMLEKIYSFCLLLFAYANTVKGISSGGRFQSVFYLFATLYLIMLFSKSGIRKLSPITIIGFLPMLLWFAMEYRRGLETMNAMLIGPLPLPFIFSFTLY